MYDIYIHLITRYMCKFYMTVYNVIIGYLVHPLSFVLLRDYLMYVKLQFRKCLQVKSYRKSKRVAAYGLIEFYCQKDINLCYYLSGSFSLLSGFNCLLDDYWMPVYLHSS
jgi:hypothetical protein